MSAAPSRVAMDPLRWPRRRWWLLLALVLGGQLGIIFWLGESSPILPRVPSRAPTVEFAGRNTAELLALDDPTLFALPHRESFAGLAWLASPPVPFRSFEWVEPPRWLLLPVQQLGRVLNQFLETNRFDALQTLASPGPEPKFLRPSAMASFRRPSTLRLEGPLADRRLLSTPELREWPATDVLANTVVQLVADADGQPRSVTLLARSGLPAADAFALAQARAARFEPLPGNHSGTATNAVASLAWGRMIFEWNTVPVPLTNAPVGNPK